MIADRQDGPSVDGLPTSDHDLDESRSLDGDDHLSLRKRRQRSHSSPELYQADAYPFPQTATSTSGPSSSSATFDLHTAPSSRGEDSLTLRRREANRLAAQRFRSRKKGYQDSLEERIRALEEERDGLLQRLGESSSARSEDDPYVRYPSYAPPSSRRPNTGVSGPSVSPERREAADVDVRVAALESANRRLQEELKGAYEENDRLREELDGWKRTASAANGQPRGPLPPLQPASYHAPSPFHAPHPPLERARSYAQPPSPGIRLPPLRLPPLPQIRGAPPYPHHGPFRGSPPRDRRLSSPTGQRPRPSD
ncbi:hypothetical protein JCM24511_02688 [Saitozyma sp. JCM 24511]|nr:hypothetical protein JCM24511_02688 [Saitozyma sp. JCM 24511]